MNYEDIEIQFRCKKALKEVTENFPSASESGELKFLMEKKGYIFNVTPPMKKDNSGELVAKFRAFDLDAFDDEVAF